MDNFLYLLAPVGCAVMMAVCMWMMSRGTRRDGPATPAEHNEDKDVAALRAEVAQLRAERGAASIDN